MQVRVTVATLDDAGNVLNKSHYVANDVDEAEADAARSLIAQAVHDSEDVEFTVDSRSTIETPAASPQAEPDPDDSEEEEVESSNPRANPLNHEPVEEEEEAEDED